ncbi:hypothetical protein F5882DRAFT_420198 [Hyaloscypha sp. PMI_1271]|nr:hypothetical protein F5882DRAFT_420198 [Hyaloscypha sp. PMI_1271]
MFPLWPSGQPEANLEVHESLNTQDLISSLHSQRQRQESCHTDGKPSQDDGIEMGRATDSLAALEQTVPETDMSATDLASPGLPATQPVVSQQPRPSRSSSIHSVISGHSKSRIEKAVSRKSSIRSAASSMFSCFDSRSERSAASKISKESRQTRGSRRSLDKFARAAIKAVKAVGACWRCKFLRKSCSDETPCGSCPKNAQRSDWQALGCRRGNLREEMNPLILCPVSVLSQPTFFDLEPDIQQENDECATVVNQYSRRCLEIREKGMKTVHDALPLGIESLGHFLSNLDKKLPTRNGSSVSFAVSIGGKWPAILLPLDDCIQNIIWELSFLHTSQSVFDGRTIQEAASMLRSAALCQVTTEDNQLIAQSLICLRGSLEVLRVIAAGKLKSFSHRNCKTELCQIDCITNLDADVSRYINELSRVFFLKESTRNIRTWWISGFYSLVIQSFVRRALIEVIPHISSQGFEARCRGAREFLQLAVRLFVAATRSYDPLIRQSPEDYGSACPEDGGLHLMEVRIVQLAVKQADWRSSAVQDSGVYLKRLFQDDGSNLLSNDKASATRGYSRMTNDEEDNTTSEFSKIVTGLWTAGPADQKSDPSTTYSGKQKVVDVAELVSMHQSKGSTIKKSLYSSFMLFKPFSGKPASL